MRASRTERQGFFIRAGRPTAMLSMLAFAGCVPTQILGYADRLHEPGPVAALVLLTALSAVLMIAVILCCGKNRLWLSIFPICIGVLGFVFKLALDPWEHSALHHVFAVLLYAAIVVLWALTVLYVVKTKWVLAVLFSLSFLKHIIINDIPVLLGLAPPVPASTWFKEACMLLFMLALCLCAVSFEKNETP